MTPTSTPREAIRIRPARQDDLSLMARWAEAMALETEDRQLDAAVVSRGIRRAFEDAGKGRYFIAEIAGRPVGTLMLTSEWSDWRDGWWWWIQSVFVDTGFRRRGVYGALYAHVHALGPVPAPGLRDGLGVDPGQVHGRERGVGYHPGRSLDHGLGIVREVVRIAVRIR